MSIWNPAVSWTALELLSGPGVTTATAELVERARAKLASSTVEEIAAGVVTRTAVINLEVPSGRPVDGRSDLTAIKAELAALRSELVLTAGSADSQLETDLAHNFYAVDGYLPDNVDYSDFVEKHGLINSGDGARVRIWAKPEGFSWGAAGYAPAGVIAADLMAGWSTREVSAGRAALQRMLNEYRS